MSFLCQHEKMGNSSSTIPTAGIQIEVIYPDVHPKKITINQSLTSERKQERLKHIWDLILNSGVDTTVLKINLLNYQIDDECVLNMFFEKISDLKRKLKILVEMTHDSYSTAAYEKIKGKIVETNESNYGSANAWFEFMISQ